MGNLTEKTFYTLLICCVILFAGGLFMTLMSAITIDRFELHKIHGVHETTFGFTGDYTIRGEVKKDKLWYVGYCSATTMSHGNCKYAYYKSKDEEIAYQYNELYCGKNGTATPLDGYISTETQECQLDEFNREICKWVIVCVVGFIVSGCALFMYIVLGCAICTDTSVG
jgi:hypothetical protein